MAKSRGPIHFIRRLIRKNILGSRKYRRMDEFARRFPETEIHWTCDIAKIGAVEIGSGTYFGENGRILSYHPDDSVKIGKYCSIAGDVIFVNGGDHDFNQVTLYNPLNYLKDGQSFRGEGCSTVIGSDVWIATRALIIGPVTIGHGAAIAGGAVVTSDVPPYTVVAGVPAKPLRQRANPEQAEKLVKIAWWDWPRDKILERAADLTGPVDKFIEKYYSEEVMRES